jgi:Zn-dependent protease with chaperone function
MGRSSGRAALRPLLIAAAVAVGAVAWAIAAHRLWRTTVPGDLRMPHLDPHRFFSAAFLRRSASYERFLVVDRLLGELVLVAVLAVYARRGHVLMRESAAGPIGTGMLLGMLGLAIVWLAELPFEVAAVWWQRGHGVSHQNYVLAVLQSFWALGGTFLAVCLALLIAMGLARLLHGWWWALAAPAFVGLALLLAYLGILFVPATHPLRDRAVLADARTLARVEGVPGTKVVVQDVHRETTAPNAEAVGFGAMRRVVLWDTLLRDRRFTRREIRAVVAHELGHLSRHHTSKGVGWLALFLIPAAGVIALATRGRGGMGRPEAVPVALLVLVLLQFVTLPLANAVSRHQEAEADWVALRATHDPAAVRAAFRQLARASLADPDPPGWSTLIAGTHPTSMQRIGMSVAYERRASGR